MSGEAWLTLGIIGALLVALACEWAGPDVILMGGLLALAACGVLTPAETFAGFANESMLTVGALLVLSTALRETGALEIVFGRLFGRSRSELTGLLRMMGPVAALSAFLNNTTIVAMMTPVVIDWTRRNRFSPARFLIPLDYATILGGVVTIIGTSTNLTVAGLMTAAGMRPMGFFELTPVGLPVCLAGLAFLGLFAQRLLPVRKDVAEELGAQRREYTAAMVVEGASPLVGDTVEGAGLRHLPGLFLVEIDRRGKILTPVASDERLEAGDRLVFAGVVATIVDLQKIRGLAPASNLDEPPPAAEGRRLVEAVVSHSSPLVGRNIREANFRTVYDAAVLAVHRSGGRVAGKIGDILLRAGDVLLLQTSAGFLRAHGSSADFYLVSDVGGTEHRRHDRAWVAGLVLLGLVAVVALEWFPISIASFLAAGALVATRCITASQARRSIEWSILIVIAASLGIGAAVEKTGLAAAIASGLTAQAGALGPTAALALIYFATVLLTEAISNNAAAALMFPIAVATAAQLHVDARGFIMAICVAASCGFATPFGYQTHLIVYGAGGYRFNDFVRVGLPLDVLCGVVAVLVIPLFWPF